MSKRRKAIPYATRGGLKMEQALKVFQLDPTEKVVMDVGASHGGFTDCLLKFGARKIYAVDVGYGQLDWKLRNDSRVVVLERQNIRHLPEEKVPEKMDWVVIDVAFISLKKVFPAIEKFLKPPATDAAGEPPLVIALAKPQFELPSKLVPKGGVVTDPELHLRVLDEVRRAGLDHGWKFLNSTPSPILGAEGNREFLMVFESGKER